MPAGTPDLTPLTLRVLHVEDDPDFSNLVSASLRRPKPSLFDLALETRLDRALRRLERESWELLLLDLGLPDGSADFAVGTACSLAHHLPVVLLSASAESRYLEAASRIDTCRYLMKSAIDWRGFPELLRRAVVDHRRLTHALEVP